MMKQEQLVKIVIVGEAHVGKTSILKRYCDGKFSDNMITTLGIDYAIKRMEIDGHAMKLQIWDTAGQERFHSMTQNFYKGAMAIVLVFDLSDYNSFLDLQRWIDRIQNFEITKVVKIILANKCELNHNVNDEQIQELQTENQIPVFQVSAKDNKNIDEAFIYLVKEIKRLQINGQQKKNIKLFDDLEQKSPIVNQQKSKQNCC